MRTLPPASDTATSLATYAPTSDRPPVRSLAHLHALGGVTAVLHAAGADEDWNPSEDEHTGGFDVHLGVYTKD